MRAAQSLLLVVALSPVGGQAAAADAPRLPLPIRAESIASVKVGEIREFKGGERKLVLVMGEHDLPTVVSLNGALKEMIAQLAPEGLSCRLQVIADAEHVPPDSLREGLRTVFQGWKPPRP